ncbi:MAG: class I SAM-dependent methyltransferase [Candidatus Binatia bacterium]
MKLIGGDRVRRALADQAVIRSGQRILDIGCGTGSLVVLLKRLHPDAEVVGLDPDPKALSRARRKAQRAALSVRLDRGFSDELPYPEASFDLVFSSFMFHHLEADEQETTLREVRRVLEPGGALHMLDFGGPDSGAGGFLTRFLHSSHRLKENSASRILDLMSRAGFADPKNVGHRAMLFGHVAYYRASVPTA